MRGLLPPLSSSGGPARRSRARRLRVASSLRSSRRRRGVRMSHRSRDPVSLLLDDREYTLQNVRRPAPRFVHVAARPVVETLAGLNTQVAARVHVMEQEDRLGTERKGGGEGKGGGIGGEQ